MLYALMLTVVVNGGVETRIEVDRIPADACAAAAAAFNAHDPVARFMSAAPVAVATLGRDLAETDDVVFGALCDAV